MCYAHFLFLPSTHPLSDQFYSLLAEKDSIFSEKPFLSLCTLDTASPLGLFTLSLYSSQFSPRAWVWVWKEHEALFVFISIIFAVSGKQGMHKSHLLFGRERMRVGSAF